MANLFWYFGQNAWNHKIIKHWAVALYEMSPAWAIIVIHWVVQMLCFIAFLGGSLFELLARKVLSIFNATIRGFSGLATLCRDWRWFGGVITFIMVVSHFFNFYSEVLILLGGSLGGNSFYLTHFFSSFRPYCQFPSTALEKFTTWCSSAGSATSPVVLILEKSTYFYNEKIWATNQSTATKQE